MFPFNGQIGDRALTSAAREHTAGGRMTAATPAGGARHDSLATDASGKSGRAWAWWLLAVLAMAALCPAPAVAEPRLLGRRDPLKADASAAAKDEAIRLIPYQGLDSAARAKIDSVLADTALFRRLPVQVIQCDPEMYLFLVEHPDVVVNIWEVFGITQLAVHEIARDTFRVAEEGGTRGTMELLYASHDTHVFFAEGDCNGPMTGRPIHGRTLVVLKSGYVRETDGQYYVTCRLDAFLQVDRAGVELVTKTLQPIIGKVADVNFAQTVGFLGSLSRTAAANPSGVARLALKLTEVQPPVRDRFVELAQQVAAKTAQVAVQPGEIQVAAEEPSTSIR
jgi:hypothetical protein